jgi:hypothetical protein
MIEPSDRVWIKRGAHAGREGTALARKAHMVLVGITTGDHTAETRWYSLASLSTTAPAEDGAS